MLQDLRTGLVQDCELDEHTFWLTNRICYWLPELRIQVSE